MSAEKEYEGVDREEVIRLHKNAMIQIRTVHQTNNKLKNEIERLQGELFKANTEFGN